MNPKVLFAFDGMWPMSELHEIPFDISTSSTKHWKQLPVYWPRKLYEELQTNLEVVTH